MFSAVEPCSSFDVAGDRATGRLPVVRRRRKCLHFSLYYLRSGLGLCHVRAQSWFPFEVQGWVNGRQWLARELDAAGIGYPRHANTFVKLDDFARAQQIANRAARKAWPRLLDSLVRPLNTGTFSAEDILGFLGRKLPPALAAEVGTDTRRRPQG